KKIRYDKNGHLRSQFTDINFARSETIFDSKVVNSKDFFGFYTLFWVVVLIIFTNRLFQNFKNKSFQFQIVQILIKDIFKIGFTDLLMYLLTFFSLFVQHLIKLNYLTWEKLGWLIESVIESSIVFFSIWFSNFNNYPWIGRIFLFLHSLVLIMKIHSYAFYNGYLWKIKNELKNSLNLLNHYQNKLNKLNNSNENENENENETPKHLIHFCEFELNTHSSKDSTFPNNINVKNFVQYTLFPTLVYQIIEYPRTQKIRWNYLLIKIIAIFGVIALMTTLAQEWMYPIVLKICSLKASSFTDKLKEYPFVFLDMVPPFILMYLLVFYLIWDAILNAIAELTRFGDREFYGYWWNSRGWDEFSRDWNKPVHFFLLRHVYHSSISFLDLDKNSATIFTFLLSSLVHELCMFVLFGKLRFYLFFMQMFQLPLVALSRTKYLKNRKILGNLIFWLGLVTGPSLTCTLYLTF
ncbi:sterol acyltransferase, partial [Ascoidea rubescens DSM 1968]